MSDITDLAKAIKFAVKAYAMVQLGKNVVDVCRHDIGGGPLDKYGQIPLLCKKPATWDNYQGTARCDEHKRDNFASPLVEVTNANEIRTWQKLIKRCDDE